jgi:hypothetical protein
MKKNLIKKLVLKKHTVTSLDAEQLEALRGGNMNASMKACSEFCDSGPTGGGAGITSWDWGCRG